ncbi:MAG: GNAT family N-acetyltransferase [Hyphomicrobiaceae bacterium]
MATGSRTGEPQGREGVAAIRPLEASDLTELLELYRQGGLGGDRRMDKEEAADLLARISRYPDYRILIATDEHGGIVGTYALLIMDNIAHGGRPLAIVEQVAVRSDRQRGGIGTALMEDAMARAAAAGCYKLALSSNVKFAAAHAFYERLRFERHGYSFVVDPSGET